MLALVGAGLLAATIAAIRVPVSPDITQFRIAQAGGGSLVRDPAPLLAQVSKVAAASGGTVGMTLIDLNAAQPVRVSFNGGTPFPAASTYKLPLLMAEAERIAAGTWKPTDSICFQDGDYEDGWFGDYADGDCFTRQTLAERAGIYSDNTAGHMLARDLGGADALNAYAKQRGAGDSAFFEPNETTAADLAALMATEARGGAGGAAAQRWLYPLLTNTAFETGLPGGVPNGVTVTHKIGEVDQSVNDVGFLSGQGRNYVLAVTTIGIGGDDAWKVVAAISQLAWQYAST